MQAFNDVFDALVEEFGPHLLIDLGIMVILFDFREKNSFLNYKGARSRDEAHRLLREYLDRN
jgi:hypothetical protein